MQYGPHSDIKDKQQKNIVRRRTICSQHGEQETFQEENVTKKISRKRGFLNYSSLQPPCRCLIDKDRTNSPTDSHMRVQATLSGTINFNHIVTEPFTVDKDILIGCIKCSHELNLYTFLYTDSIFVPTSLSIINVLMSFLPGVARDTRLSLSINVRSFQLR